MARQIAIMPHGRWSGRASVARAGLCLLLLAAAPAVAQTDTNGHPEVKAAIDVLLSGDMIEAVDAGMKLGKLGKPAVAPLIAVLETPGFGGKFLAASALGDIGADAEPAVPNLIELLANEDPEVRMGAAEALGKIKAQPDLVMPALQRLARDPEAPVRSAAGTALLRLGAKGDVAAEASAELLEGLKSDDSSTRRAALRTLGADPALGKANVAAIVAAIEDENGSVAAEAMRMLAALGEDGKAGVPVLIRRLGANDSFIVHRSMETLGDMRAVAKDAVPALTGFLDKDKFPLDPQSEGIIAKAARALGYDTGGATIDLATPAAIAIEWIDPGNTAAQAVLNRRLSDRKGDSEYPIKIAKQKLERGENSPEITAALIYALDDGIEYIRRRAAIILAGLGRAEGVPALVEALSWDNETVPREAMEAMAKLGPAASAALPALQEISAGKSSLSEAARATIAKIEGR